MDLKELLTEVKLYLGTVLGKEKLSPGAEAARLQLLSLLQASSNYGYLDMSFKKSLTSGEKSLHMWQSSGYEQVMPDLVDGGHDSLVISSPIVNGVNGFSGSLSRRTKLLFVGQLKRYWASLADSSLRLFSSTTDSKPAVQLEVSGYTARPVLANQSGASPKRDLSFELICPGKKTYQFVAANEKELEGWVQAVNSLSGQNRQLPVPPPMATPPLEGPFSRPKDQPPRPRGHSPIETYDVPDSRVRPVVPQPMEDYETMIGSGEDVISDTLYHNIDEKHRAKQEEMYKNVGHDMYYNLLPEMPEEIYQVINEEKHELYEPVSSQTPSRASR